MLGADGGAVEDGEKEEASSQQPVARIRRWSVAGSGSTLRSFCCTRLLILLARIGRLGPGRRRESGSNGFLPMSLARYSGSAVCPRRLVFTNPVAIFAGIETAERRNWRVMPKRSSEGNFCVSLYTFKTNWCAFCQISKSRKVLAGATTDSAATALNLSFWLLAAGYWLLSFHSSVCVTLRRDCG
jgi:hypothetical protein